MVEIPAEAETRSPFLLREGVLLAVVPVLGYAVAYAFAVGQALQFGIPYGLVSVNLDSVFLAIGVVVGSLAFVYSVTSFFLMFPASSKLASLATRPDLAALGLIVLVLAVARPGYWWWVGLIGIWLFIQLLSWGLAMAAQKNVKGIRHRFHAAATAQPDSRETGWTQIYQRVGFHNMSAVLLAFLFIVLAFIAGGANAIHQKVFLVESGTHLAVLATYGNTLILEGFQHNQLTGHFVVRGLTSQPSLVLVSRSIGPLLSPKI